MEIRFNILTPDHVMHRLAMPLDDPTILSPTATNRLYQGEWLMLVAGKLKRLAAAGATTTMVYPVLDMESSYDIRALGNVSVPWSGGAYEFQTSVYDTAHAPATVGAYCYVGLIVYPAGGGISRMIIDDNTASGASGIARVTATASGGVIKALKIWA